MAMENAIDLHCEDRTRFTQSDLFKDVTRSYNLVCANLPYIPTDELAAVNSLPYEPRLALDGGKTGSELIERGMLESRIHLIQPALLLYEFKYDKAAEIEKLAEKYFPQADRRILKDLAGLDRIMRIEEA